MFFFSYIVRVEKKTKLNIDQKPQLAADDTERQLVLICFNSTPAQLLNMFKNKQTNKLYVNVFTEF